MMTQEELKAIERRAAAASPGPWNPSAINHGWDFFTLVTENHVGPGGKKLQERVVANIEFAANARCDVPALIAEVRRLHDRLAIRECPSCGWDGKMFCHDSHCQTPWWPMSKEGWECLRARLGLANLTPPPAP